MPSIPNNRFSFSGVVPSLSLRAGLGPPRSEIAGGALMAWADRLWVATYVSHKSRSGVGGGLYEIDENLNLVQRPESYTGTYTNRYVHFPSNQLIIGPWVIDPDRNVRRVDALLETHDVIPLAAVDDEARGRRPQVVITFDDAYRGAMTTGLAELEARGLPATVFVAPGLFGTTAWWDRLADPRSGSVPDSVRGSALLAQQGRSHRVLGALAPGGQALPPWAQIATETEVLDSANRPGVTLGAHGWSHANLAVLEGEDLSSELERPLEWLRAGHDPKVVADLAADL